jgi:hypothetical protein
VPATWNELPRSFAWGNEWVQHPMVAIELGPRDQRSEDTVPLSGGTEKPLSPFSSSQETEELSSRPWVSGSRKTVLTTACHQSAAILALSLCT